MNFSARSHVYFTLICNFRIFIDVFTNNGHIVCSCYIYTKEFIHKFTVSFLVFERQHIRI